MGQVHPLIFASLRVSKSTMEFVRFEAECGNRETLARLRKALDGSQLKTTMSRFEVIGFYEALKVRAGEAKLEFPTRHDWDSFFRDAEHMNELRAGERPDTVYLAQLPVRWFQMPESGEAPPTTPALPSEPAMRKVFETFGEVRSVDIPICDPHRKHMSKTGMKTTGFSYGAEVCFEAYVQFVEYISFVKCMDTLRGMKLVLVKEGKASGAAIKVDFDRTKHLADKSIRRRRLEREELAAAERVRAEKAAAESARLEAERAKLDNAAFQRRQTREEKRRIKAAEKKRIKEEQDISRKIALEERRLLLAERKLAAIRLLTDLFRRVHQSRKSATVASLESDLEALIKAERQVKDKGRAEEAQRRQRLLQRREEILKQKMLKQSQKEQEEGEAEADSSFEQPPVRSQVARITTSSVGEGAIRRKRRASASPEILGVAAPPPGSRRVRPPPPSRNLIPLIPERQPLHRPPMPDRRVVPAPQFQPRRVQPPGSPPVREGGGDPFELQLDSD